MKNRKLMMPLFSFLCFIIVTASPIFLSLKDSQSINNSADSVDSETYSYTYNDVGLKFLEKSIAKANGVLDYASPSENVYIHFDVNKIKDVDLADKTIYISGKVSGTWIPDSIGKVSIANSSEYNFLKFNSYEQEDIMRDMVIPNMINDDFFTYERVLFNKLKSRTGGDVFASEYRFSGNLNFPPDLRDFPADKQNVELSIQHKILPSHMLKLVALKPSINLGNIRDFLVGSYKVSPPKKLMSYVQLPYSDELVRYFSSNPKKESETYLNRLILETESSLSANSDSKINSSDQADLENIKKIYFSRNSGPLSTAAIDIPLTRQISTTWFKSIFPVALSLIALVVASYIPHKISEVRLAIPPTILLSLVFMQQASHDGLPEVAYPILLDYFYLLAYVVTLLMFFETILISCFEENNLNQFAFGFQKFSRICTLLAAAFGMPAIWLLSRFL